jgi:hypothetical protein
MCVCVWRADEPTSSRLWTRKVRRVCVPSGGTCGVTRTDSPRLIHTHTRPVGRPPNNIRPGIVCLRTDKKQKGPGPTYTDGWIRIITIKRFHQLFYIVAFKGLRREEMRKKKEEKGWRRDDDRVHLTGCLPSTSNRHNNNNNNITSAAECAAQSRIFYSLVVVVCVCV